MKRIRRTGWEDTPVLSVVHDAEGANDNGATRSLLEEIAAYVAAFADQLDNNGLRLVVCNRYHQPRDVATAAGAVQVNPRVND